MTVTLRELLEARSTRAYDLDDEGRVLVGNDDTGTVQLYEIDTDGGWTRLTDLGESCVGRYLPGERTVIVQHDAGGNERAQLSLLRLQDDTTGPAEPAEPVLVPLVHDERYIHSLLDVLPGRVVYMTNRRNGVDFDVVVRDVASGAERVHYDGGGYVMDVSVSPDERYLVVTRPGRPAMSGQLVLVDTGTGGREDLTDAADPAVNRHLGWLPDSSGFIFTTNSGREYTGVAHYDLATRSWRYRITDDEHDLTGWPSPDGRRVLVAVNDDGADVAALHDAESGYRVSAIDLPEPGVFSAVDPMWSPGSQRLALSVSTPREPLDVYVWSGGASPRRLTESTPDLDTSTLVTPESHRIPTPDGETVPCFLYRDADCDGSVVLVVHGGPESASMRSWNPIVQGLVAQGHAVAVPNVRGSTGYGKRWYTLDDVRDRLSSVADLAAVHAWLPSVGLDQRRAGLYGRSYGGYMVLAGLAFQPGLWAAGVDIVGISSLVTFLRNTSGYRRAHREREYGSLERDGEFLTYASPLTHVTDIRAPLLILHGANDPRVPVTEAEQVAAAVRSRGLECELVVYADEGHALAKRHTLLDTHPRAAEFLRRHLSGQPIA
ncbi:MAG TPA: alpha/beta fold hydrolase [Mycobacteriales bacterium]|nr:alpha/beta fold hydrolase [Mycobacteriales bacterium]